MKIWEIEEGREFMMVGSRRKYRKEDGKLYYWDYILEKWKKSLSPYNSVIQDHFEYLPEKKYYLKAKEELQTDQEWGYLNHDKVKDMYYLSDKAFDLVLNTFQTKFTEEEIAKIPALWLTICDRVEVE